MEKKAGFCRVSGLDHSDQRLWSVFSELFRDPGILRPLTREESETTTHDLHIFLAKKRALSELSELRGCCELAGLHLPLCACLRSALSTPLHCTP